SPTLAVTEGIVALFTGVGSGHTAQLVGVDERTGSVAWHSQPREFNGWPVLCPDDATVVCTTATDPAAQTALLRLEAATGHQLPSPIISTDSAGRDLGPGLYDPGTRTPDLLVGVVGGSVTWRHP